MCVLKIIMTSTFTKHCLVLFTTDDILFSNKFGPQKSILWSKDKKESVIISGLVWIAWHIEITFYLKNGNFIGSA